MKTNKILSGALALTMALGMSVPVFAAEPPSTVGVERTSVSDGTGTSIVKVSADAIQMDVTVPMALVASVDERGQVFVASDAKIINNSYGAVKVSDLTATAQGDWTLVDEDHAFNKDAVGSKNVSVSIDEKFYSTDTTKIEVSSALSAQIDGTNDTDSDERGFTYDLAISPQKEALSDETIANVVFTVEWA